MKKLALMFLTTGDLPFADLWLRWLEGRQDRVRIVVHAHHRAAVFSPFREYLIAEHVDDMRHGGRHPHNRDVIATLAMIRAAMADEDVTEMVLLNESILPICPFDKAYSVLVGTGLSWMSFFPASPPYPDRYAMLPACGIPKDKFFCTDQWIALNRAHAQIGLDSAAAYLEPFEWVTSAGEHYFPTVLAMAGVNRELEIVPQTPTFVDWSPKTPKEFKYMTEGDMKQLTACGCLFARKFPCTSAIREVWGDLLEANSFQFAPHPGPAHK